MALDHGVDVDDFSERNHVESVSMRGQGLIPSVGDPWEMVEPNHVHLVWY